MEDTLEESELVNLLCEVCPSFALSTVQVITDEDGSKRVLHSPKKTEAEIATLEQKLQTATPLHGGKHLCQPNPLTNIQPYQIHPLDALQNEALRDQFDANTDGELFLCFFSKDKDIGDRKPTSSPYSAAVMKFRSSRLETQVELFTNELACYLNIPTPTAKDSKNLDCEALVNIGKLFVLDMALGNPDRLPCEDLRWRGNSGNVLLGSELSRFKNQFIAIDSCFPRQPPSFQLTHEKHSITKTAELMLNDKKYCTKILLAIVSQWSLHYEPFNWDQCTTLFHSGLFLAIQELSRIKGLFEMMHNVLTQWIEEFIEDLEKESPSYKAHMFGRTSSTIELSNTMQSSDDTGHENEHLITSELAKKRTPEKIKLIIKRSDENNIVCQKLDYWKNHMTDRGNLDSDCTSGIEYLFFALGKELKGAILRWQQRHNEREPITTGFLDGASPIVDAYELKLRLGHILRRLRFLLDAHATEPPSKIFDHLYVGNALSSQGIHLLRHIGITHIINATKVGD
eukprot:g2984.t1